MVSNEQSAVWGIFMHPRRGEGWGGQAGRRRREGCDFHSNSQVPSCHVWAEIGAVSIGTT